MPTQQSPTSLDARTHFVYRFFDAGDRLLYVGLAVDPNARLLTHQRDKPWWPEVARTTLAVLPTRADAEYYEAHAILTEHPLHNLAIPSLARLDALFSRATKPGQALVAKDRIESLEEQLKAMTRRARQAEAETARLGPQVSQLRDMEARLAAFHAGELQGRLTQAEAALELARQERSEERRGWLVEVHRLEDQLRARRTL